MTKILVREFYRVNAGFFLVVLGFCFGFLRDVEHVALAQFFVSSPLLICIPLVAWIFYTIKVFNFNHQELRKPKNTFLYVFAELPVGEQALILAGVSILQLLPMLMYGAFLIIMALYIDIPDTLPITIGALIVLTTAIGVGVYRKLQQPEREAGYTFLKKWLDVNYSKPWSLLFLEWLLRSKTALFFGTKVFSMGILYGVTRLYVYDTYDWRLLGLGVYFAGTAQALLGFNLHRLENYHASWTRNLALPLPQRFGYAWIVLAILSLPEMILLLRSFPDALKMYHYASLVLLGWSVMLFCYSLLYIRDMDQDSFVKRLFAIGISGMMMILFGIPAWLIAVLLATLAFYLFQRYYYRFEFIASVDSEK